MGSESSPKIVIVDESPIRAAILEEGLREAGFTGVVHISEMQSLLARIYALDPDIILIDRAKGILMKLKGLTEDEAYVLMRSTAMREKKKIGEIAQSILTASELLK